MEVTTSLAQERAAKDQKVLDFIGDFWAKNQTAPTLAEIAEGLGLKPSRYKSWVFGACQRLVKDGKLKVIRVPFGKRRSYQVANE